MRRALYHSSVVDIEVERASWSPTSDSGAMHPAQCRPSFRRGTQKTWAARPRTRSPGSPRCRGRESRRRDVIPTDLSLRARWGGGHRRGRTRRWARFDRGISVNCASSVSRSVMRGIRDQRAGRMPALQGDALTQGPHAVPRCNEPAGRSPVRTVFSWPPLNRRELTFANRAAVPARPGAARRGSPREIALREPPAPAATTIPRQRGRHSVTAA
jgi:hypothetical protein